MKKSKKSRKKRKQRNPWLYPLVLVVAFAVSCGGSYLYFKDLFVFESSFIAEIESRNSGAGPDELKGKARLYETRMQGPAVKGSVILRKDALLVVAENIIRKYFESYKVRLLDLYMDKKGIIYIDVGGELKRNFKGDAFEELAVIAGLYNKIKFTIPDFTALMFLIDGRESESFGGHIDISRPIGEEIAEAVR